MKDPTIYRLTLLAVALSLGHHVDHVVRGNQVGWPVSAEVNAFTASLAIYPVVALGLYLYARNRVGPGFWALVSGGGALFLAAIHFGPWGIEPPGDIIDAHDAPAVGWLAFAWLIALVAVLVVTFVYEVRAWRRQEASRPFVRDRAEPAGSP